MKLLLILLLTTTNLYASFFTELKIRDHLLPTQSQSGYTNACVPTSFFYMLKYNYNQEYINNVSGRSDFQKLDTIIQLGLSLDSITNDDAIFDPGSGTSFKDEINWLNELISVKAFKPKLTLAHRLESEKRPKQFLKRVHTSLKDLIKAGKPAKLSIQFRAVDYETSYSDFKFGHSVVLIGIQSQLQIGDLGFMIEYLDPNSGTPFTAYIYEEINNPFNAPLYDSNHIYHWSDGKRGVLNDDDEFVSSPYLRVIAPLITPGTAWGWEEEVDSILTNYLNF